MSGTQKYHRRVVRQFARLMVRKLDENAHKGGWDGEDPDWLLSRLREEARELARVLRRGDNPVTSPGSWSIEDKRRVGREAADVANFAMMIADVCDGLAQPATPRDKVTRRTRP